MAATGTRNTGSNASPKDASWTRGVKMSILAYCCCCFVLSVGSARTQSPASGIRLLTSAMARGPAPWAHALRIEGPARLEDAEDAADAAWVPKGLLRKGSDVIVPPPLVAMTETSDDRGEITDLLSGSPWALVAVRQYPGGKRHSLSFTPRLGRDSDEDDDGVDEEQDGEDDGGEMVVVRRRTPPFAPRLGRRSSPGVMPFSPRLGRRRTRSGPPGEEVQSPSAGNNPDRNLIFSPRLGRSSSQANPGSLRSESDGRAQLEESGTKET
ncbi:uncharacterized protein LOC124162135 [Ischnura elegans]|uniref:uncharacterized protein LOC124162135 n=1 Tax=Ischnura elegans TaxID=197161 RepID=UPI001ED87E1F|nr:uncharacterized protein LOC124162135 [Ischnura elegans]